MSFKVLFLDEMDLSGKNLIRQAGGEVVVSRALDEAGRIRELKDLRPHGILTRSTPVTAAMLEASPNLKVVGKHGVGLRCIDMAAAADRDVQVVFAPGATDASIAQHAMMMILMCAARFGVVNDQLRRGCPDIPANLQNSFELCGMTLGLMGCGRIAQLLAKMAVEGFGMEVMAYDPYFPKTTLVPIRKASQNEVLQQADFVSMHMPLMPSTRGSFGRQQFRLMKPTASFINCCRGEVLVEEDLITALREGDILGAALDVVRDEPIPADHPFVSMPNVVLTPHTAGVTRQAAARCCAQACEGIVDVIQGRSPKWPATFRNGH